MSFAQRYDLVELLGQPADALAVENALRQLRIVRRPACRRSDEDDPDTLETQDWVANRRLGIEFGFEDAAAFHGRHPDEEGREPMLLTEVYFYGTHPDVKPFPGRLPLGLSLDDDRSTVRRKLAAWENVRRSCRRDTWELPDYRLAISYTMGGKAIALVLCLLRRARVMADDDDATGLPSIDGVISVLGRPLNDPELGLVLRKFDLEHRLEDHGGMLVANFVARFGAEVCFTHIGGSRQYALSQVILYPAHTPGAAGWPGGLPRSLTFDDGPEALLAKMGRAPDELTEIDLTLRALWRYESYVVVIMFSAAENIILSVQLVAPGALMKSQR